MTLREQIDSIDEQMRQVKDDRVAADPDDPELPIFLNYWRGDALVAAIQTQLDRDQAIRVSVVGAAGFNATAMAVTFESWISELKDSPITGKPWRQGEMNFIGRTVPDAFEKGWVTETLSTSIHDREGKYYLSKQPFRLVDGAVVWGDREVIPEEGDEIEGSGVMYEAFQWAMEQPTMLDRMAEVATEEQLIEVVMESVPDTEKRLFHCDMATLQALDEINLDVAVMLFAERNSERAQWIAERAEDLGLTAGVGTAAPHAEMMQKAVRDDFYGTDK